MFDKPRYEPETTVPRDLLGESLLALPDPQMSDDFNTGIHIALANKPAERPAWYTLRPALAAACGSFVLTLTLLTLFSHSILTPGSPRSSVGDTPAVVQSASMRDVDSLIERADLRSATIRYIRLPAPKQATSASEAPNATHTPTSQLGPAIRRLQGA